ncbi:hypothetical protein D9M68_564970 [compost metagenome]
MRWIGAFAAWASSTSRMMRASTLSAPTARTSMTMRPSPFTAPPVSASPGFLATGSGSPVSIDSSTSDCPSSTRASAGTRSPGRTASRSPTITSASGTSLSLPRALIRCATSGRSCCSARIAEVAWRLARASSHLPSSTSVITTAEASKYRCGTMPCPACSPVAARHHSHSDRPKAALVPSATSRSMLPVRALAACQPAR